jgi:putative nucleotidyltransferase with HDIG domain
MADARPTTPAMVLAATGLAGAFAWFLAVADERVLDPLTLMLAAGAVGANLLAVRFHGRMFVSASFTCSIVGLAVLGPAAAFVIALVGEAGERLILRFSNYALAVNVLGAGVPNLLAGTLFVTLGPHPDDPIAFNLALAPAAILALTTSYMIVATLSAPSVAQGARAALHPPSPFAPALLWAVPVAGGVAFVSTQVQTLGLLALVLLLLGVTYMLQLVAAQRATSAQRSLAGHDLVAGMLRALQQRDEESARHAAAVAKYASDLAGAAGLDDVRRRDAHAAGLLHDLGRLSIPDAAFHANANLTDREWQAIQRHPAAGAEMLRHAGLEEEIAAAVAAHHERIDGRGYPDGLRGDEIPVLARIVAVAEVYDTLTAGTTYREPMSSFQALNELRRVGGSQLDERFVEALAAVLAHRTHADRHATTVDFDAELAFERLAAQAAVPS